MAEKIFVALMEKLFEMRGFQLVFFRYFSEKHIRIYCNELYKDYKTPKNFIEIRFKYGAIKEEGSDKNKDILSLLDQPYANTEVFLSAESGWGKTTALKKIVSHFGRIETNEVVPIHIDLADNSSFDENNYKQVFARHMLGIKHRGDIPDDVYNKHASVNLFNYLFKKGRLVILLDKRGYPFSSR